jgi:hypothetical protein
VLNPLEQFGFVPSVVPVTAQITGMTRMRGRPTIGMWVNACAHWPRIDAPHHRPSCSGSRVVREVRCTAAGRVTHQWGILCPVPTDVLIVAGWVLVRETELAAYLGASMRPQLLTISDCI